MKQHAHVSEWNEVVCLSFAWEMKGCRFRCNALWFVRGSVCGGGGGLLSFFFWGFLIWGRVCWLTPILSARVYGGEWLGGDDLDSHRFLLCGASSELFATRVNAENRGDLLLPSVLSASSQGWILLSGVTRADLRPALPGLCWCLWEK